MATILPSTSPSPDMAHSFATATAKVFATPELLEHILIAYAEDAVEPRKKMEDHAEGPILALYVWQRIDKTTKSTIQGSVKLRRYMWIDPVRDGSIEAEDMLKQLEDVDGDPDVLAPLVWLVDIMGLWKYADILANVYSNETKDNFDFYAGDIDTETDSPEPNSLLKKTMLGSTASWKSIRIFRIAKFKKPMTIVVSAQVWIDNLVCYEERLNLNGNTTLGDVFKWHSRCHLRSFDHHRIILQDLVENGIKSQEGSELKSFELESGARLEMKDAKNVLAHIEQNHSSG